MPVQTINHMPVQTRGCTQNNPSSNKGESDLSNTSKGWTSGLPFLNVSRWSFWGNNPEESDDPEVRPDQEYPAMMLRHSEKDEELAKSEFISTPIEAFGSVPNMFSRLPSPSTVTSVYKNTFVVNQGDDLDLKTKEDLINVMKGTMDKHC